MATLIPITGISVRSFAERWFSWAYAYNLVLKASNNEVILTSEIYNSKDAAINGAQSSHPNVCLIWIPGITSVRVHSSDAANFYPKTTKKSTSQPYYFVLRGASSRFWICAYSRSR